jgi:acyl carrier protein
MTLNEIEAKVRAYIVESFLSGDAAAAFANDDDLLLLLDSLQILRLVLAVEAQFAVKIEQKELSAENVGSVRKLAACVARKRGAAGARTPAPSRARG